MSLRSQTQMINSTHDSFMADKKQTKYMKNSYVLIMAGGVGSRFWPISRTSKPKQFIDILGTGKTLIQHTYDRFIKILPKENIDTIESYEARGMNFLDFKKLIQGAGEKK